MIDSKREASSGHTFSGSPYGTALALLLILATLYWLPTAKLTSAPFWCLTAILALPIALHLQEYRLFRHRALLENATRDGSWIRNMFSRGTFISVGALLMALAVAFTVLVIVDDLSPQYWLALTCIALLMPATSANIRSRLHGQFSERFQWIAARRTTRWFMLVALVVGVTMWDFYNAEYPVLRGHDPWQLFQTVFKEEAKKFEVHLAGGLAGFLAAIEAVGHYHGQVYGPSVDSVSLRAVLWIALLAKDAMQLSLVILLLSGVSGLMDIKRDRGWRVLGHTLFERTFMGTLVLLAAITVFGYSQMRQPPSPRTPESSLAACTAPELFDTAPYLADEKARLVVSTRQQLSDGLNDAFRLAEEKVEDYLDWHYSVKGEYELLLAAAARRHTNLIEEKLTVTIGSGVDASLAALNEGLAEHINLESVRVHAELLVITSPISLPCSTPTISLPMPDVPAPVVASAPVLAFSTAILAKKLAPKLVTKAVAKLVVKYAGKGGPILLAGLCGPAAPLCAVGLAVLSWVMVDTVAVAADEALTRDGLRDEILTDLRNELDALEANLGEAYEGEIGRSFETFNPMRDGIRGQE